NVQWGGPFGSRRTRKALRSEILRRSPDLIVLSEAPGRTWLDPLVDELGPGARCVRISQGKPGSPDGLRLAVCSRWPIRLEKQTRLPGGVAMSVMAEVRGLPLQLL